jgi:hypothetical protein
MKKFILGLIVLSSISSAMACDKISSTDVDIADAALNIVLKSKGLPRQFQSEKARLHSMFYLGKVSTRSPGLLEGKLTPCFDWPQYHSVVKMYKEAKKNLEL